MISYGSEMRSGTEKALEKNLPTVIVSICEDLEDRFTLKSKYS